MFDGIVALLHMLLAVAGPLVAADGAGLAWAVVAIAAALAIAALLHGAVTRDGAAAGAHPWRAIDTSTLLSQSDPDAAGHPRPRAPGSAAPAA
ncbi:DUF6412 domain-containing protein [Microbacterium sp. NPDC091313]